MGKHVKKTLKKEERYHFRHNLKLKEDLCARTQMKPFTEVAYQKTISRRHQNDKDNWFVHKKVTDIHRRQTFIGTVAI